MDGIMSMDIMDSIRKSHNSKCRCVVCTYECEPKPTIDEKELDRIKKVLHELGYEIAKLPERLKKNEKTDPPAAPDPDHRPGHD